MLSFRRQVIAWLIRLKESIFYFTLFIVPINTGIFSSQSMIM